MSKVNDGELDSKQKIQDAIEYVRRLNEEYYQHTGKKRKFIIHTFGCQMNEHDSEKLLGMLENMGYEKTNNDEFADVIIFNTCCVRKHAEDRVYGRISQLKRLKQKKPDLILGICGCVPQQNNVAEFIRNKYPYVDLIFGTHNLHIFPELIKKALLTKEAVIDVWNTEGEVIEGLPVTREEGVKAWVNIMYGCNNFCTYCIVPYVRGRERSRRPEDIIKEIQELVQNGYKEITLLGQNVNSYGKDFDDGTNFPSLLRMINQISGLERIRFTTSHPKDLSYDLILAMKECDKVCEHIHLPFQAGSNKILKLMNRNYTREYYMGLVEKLRNEIPEVGISTDIIVGFPGETEEDFADTVDLVKTVEFDSAFIFMYSKRTGTPAAEMTDQVPDEIKHRRFDYLVELQDSISKEKNQRLIGKVFEILVEGQSKKDENKLTGRTRTNKLVHFEGDVSLIGKLVNVKIKEAKAWTLYGEII